MFKKLLTLVVFITIVSMAAFAEGQGDKGSSDTAGPMELKWYQPEPEGHPWTDVGAIICKEIQDRTEGRITVTQYPAGSLGTQSEALDMLRTGTLALLTSGPAVMNGFNDKVQVFSLPYLFRDAGHASRAFKAPVVQELFNKDILKKSGVRTIAFWYFGDRTLSLDGGQNIKTPADLEGFKVRCMSYPVHKDVIKALGANPIPVSFSELYLALQTGVVQGQDNPIPTFYAQKFGEVQDTIVLTKHSVHVGTVHVSEQIWKSISEDDRKIILEVFDEYNSLISQKITEASEELKVELEAQGLTFVEPDLAAFKAAAEEYVDDTYGERWGDMITEIRNIK